VALHVAAIVFYRLKQEARTWCAHADRGDKLLPPGTPASADGPAAALAAGAGGGLRGAGGGSSGWAAEVLCAMAAPDIELCRRHPALLDATRAIFPRVRRRPRRGPVLPELRRRTGQLPGDYAAPGGRLLLAWSTASWPAAARCGRWPMWTTPTPAR
jgi:hypothetical protein